MLQTGRDNVTLSRLCDIEPALQRLLQDGRVAQRLEIEAQYEYAIRSQAGEVEEVKRDEEMHIPISLDYNSKGLNLSFEDREKLLRVQPATVRIKL